MMHLTYQIFELGCFNLEEALQILQFCKTNASYFMGTMKPLEHSQMESHIQILNHIMLLINDELNEPSEESVGSVALAKLRTIQGLDSVRKDLLFCIHPVELTYQFNDKTV